MSGGFPAVPESFAVAADRLTAIAQGLVDAWGPVRAQTAGVRLGHGDDQLGPLIEISLNSAVQVIDSSVSTTAHYLAEAAIILSVMGERYEEERVGAADSHATGAVAGRHNEKRESEMAGKWRYFTRPKRLEEGNWRYFLTEPELVEEGFTRVYRLGEGAPLISMEMAGDGVWGGSDEMHRMHYLGTMGPRFHEVDRERAAAVLQRYLEAGWSRRIPALNAPGLNEDFLAGWKLIDARADAAWHDVPTPLGVEDILPQSMDSLGQIHRKSRANSQGGRPKLAQRLYVLATSSGMWMAGLKFAVKSADSLEHKVGRRLPKGAEGTVWHENTFTRELSQMSDLFRYTMVAPGDVYAAATTRVMVAMGEQGFELTTADDHWADSAGYRGVNTIWVDKSGQADCQGQERLFELQFHTPESLAAREAAYNSSTSAGWSEWSERSPVVDAPGPDDVLAAQQADDQADAVGA